MTWNLSCSGILIVSTIARWTESDSLRRNSGVVPLRRAMRTSGMPDRCRRSGLGAQVEGLAPGHAEEPVLRQRDAFAGVLHARPGQHGIEVVAAIHEEGARLDLRADAEGALLVPHPDGPVHPIPPVVHQSTSLAAVR